MFSHEFKIKIGKWLKSKIRSWSVVGDALRLGR